MKIGIHVARELFQFTHFEQWVNKAQSWYKNCGVPQGRYITVDSNGHVVVQGKCFQTARDQLAFPVKVYELRLNWYRMPEPTELNLSKQPAESPEQLEQWGPGPGDDPQTKALKLCREFVAMRPWLQGAPEGKFGGLLELIDAALAAERQGAAP